MFRDIGEENAEIKDALHLSRADSMTDSLILVELDSFEEKRKIMRNKFKLGGKKIYIEDDLTKSEREMQKCAGMGKTRER